MEGLIFWLVIIIGIVAWLIHRGNRITEAADAEQEREHRLLVVAQHFEHLVEKNVQIKFHAGRVPNIILRNGESIFCMLADTTLLEARAVRRSSGAYGGPSIRLTTGISLRLGMFGGTSRSHDELREIDTGAFLLTNDRLVFIGSHRTNSIDLERLISVEPYSDGVVIHREGSVKAQCYRLNLTTDLYYEYGGEREQGPVNGHFLKAAIDQAVHSLNDPVDHTTPSQTELGGLIDGVFSNKNREHDSSEVLFSRAGELKGQGKT